MTTSLSPTLADDTVELVRDWLDRAENEPVDSSAQLLAGLLTDPGGLAFTTGFVDGVIRPEDPRVAARNLTNLAQEIPRFLPLGLRWATQLGAVAARTAPRLVIPVVRRTMRRMVGHLLIDARPRPLGQAIEKISGDGTRLNLNLLGEAILGAVGVP